MASTIAFPCFVQLESNGVYHRFQELTWDQILVAEQLEKTESRLGAIPRLKMMAKAKRALRDRMRGTTLTVEEVLGTDSETDYALISDGI